MPSAWSSNQQKYTWIMKRNTNHLFFIILAVKQCNNLAFISKTYNHVCLILQQKYFHYTYVMSCVCIFTMLGTKLSFIMLVRIAFQSSAFSPNSKQMASTAILTAWGGLLMVRISTKSFFFIPLTASIKRWKKDSAITCIKIGNSFPAHEYLTSH